MVLVVGFLGVVMGSVGGIGGGVIFVSVFVLIVGFDFKLLVGIFKCW